MAERDEPRAYEVRLSEPAELEIEAAYLRLLDATSLDFADRWHNSLLSALSGLSLFPTSQPVDPDYPPSEHEVRRLLHRYGRVVHKVPFALIDADGDGVADTVSVLHVRNASRSQST